MGNVLPDILAVCVLKLPDGRWVLQRRTDDAPTAPGLLGFFGGHLEQGESPEDCLKRELSEEISIDIESLNVHPVKEYSLPSEINFGTESHFYIFEAVAPTDEFEVYEGVRQETYTKKELKTRDDLSDVVKLVLEQDVN